MSTKEIKLSDSDQALWNEVQSHSSQLNHEARCIVGFFSGHIAKKYDIPNEQTLAYLLKNGSVMVIASTEAPKEIPKQEFSKLELHKDT